MASSVAPSAVVPHVATLDGFIAATRGADGIHVRDIEPLTTLIVHTHNSQYRIVIAHQGTVRVQGGRFFPELTVARLDGSSLGGTFLKLGWIGVGLCMELCANGQRIVTSPVRRIGREAAPRVH